MDELLVAIQDAANTIATPNWADIMSVCFSLAAVIVAGVVACKQNKISREQTEISGKQTEISREQTSIADKQNKIALFENRLEIYDILLSCSSSVTIMKLDDENDDVLKYLFVVLAKKPEALRELNRKEARLYLSNCATKLLRASFFFSEKIVSYITNVSVELLIIANADTEVDGSEKYNEKKQGYFEAIKELDANEVFKSMKAEMKMI